MMNHPSDNQLFYTMRHFPELRISLTTSARLGTEYVETSPRAAPVKVKLANDAEEKKLFEISQRMTRLCNSSIKDIDNHCQTVRNHFVFQHHQRNKQAANERDYSKRDKKHFSSSKPNHELTASEPSPLETLCIKLSHVGFSNINSASCHNDINSSGLLTVIGLPSCSVVAIDVLKKGLEVNLGLKLTLMELNLLYNILYGKNTSFWKLSAAVI